MRNCEQQFRLVVSTLEIFRSSRHFLEPGQVQRAEITRDRCMNIKYIMNNFEIYRNEVSVRYRLRMRVNDL